MDNSQMVSALPKGGLGWSAIDERELQAVTALLKDPSRLFRHEDGEERQCDLLEKELCAITGSPYALFLSSGTAALQCCLSAFEIGPGDEVILPAYTVTASSAAVVGVGAVPVIAEIDESLGLDPADVERKITPYTKAVMVVNMQGVPARLDALRALTKKHGIKLIEDCCQAIGATYRGEFCGLRSDAFAWSMNYYKVITAGEGGAFFTGDAAAFQRGLYHSDPALLQMKGGNAAEVPAFSRGDSRGNELLAAVMRVQLSKLGDILGKVRGLKKELLSGLAPARHYRLQEMDDPAGECGYAFTILANSEAEGQELKARLAKRGLDFSRVFEPGSDDQHVYINWTPILNKQGATPAGYPWKDPAYRGNVSYTKDMCPRTLDILCRSLRLTLNINMTPAQMAEVATALNAADGSF